jgi:hypothetical protein
MAPLPQGVAQKGALGMSNRQLPILAVSFQATAEGVGPLKTLPNTEVNPWEIGVGSTRDTWKLPEDGPFPVGGLSPGSFMQATAHRQRGKTQVRSLSTFIVDHSRIKD